MGCKCPEELEDIEPPALDPWRLSWRPPPDPIPWSLVLVKGENSCCCTDGWRRKITGWLGWSGDSPVVYINGSQSLSFTFSLTLINNEYIYIHKFHYPESAGKYIYIYIYLFYTYIYIYIFSRYIFFLIYIYISIHAFALNGNSQVLTSFEKLFSWIWWHWTHLARPRGDPFAGANRRIGQENSGCGENGFPVGW